MNELEELVDNAKKWMDSGQFPLQGRPESLTRQYLISPFLIWLGWSDTPTKQFHFVPEFGEGMDRRWEDYVLLDSDRPIVFIECKSLFDDDLSRYASDLLWYMREYNRKNKFGYRVDWGVLINFKEIQFYYVSEKTPFYIIKIEEFLEEQDTLRELLSVDGIKREGLEHLFSESRKEVLGDQFLQDLKKWRLILANAYYVKDQTLSVEQLKEASQQILDRLIFIRMLETLRILPYNWLRNIYLRWNEGVVGLNEPFSEVIRQQFTRIESLYDTELFQRKVCDELVIGDKYLNELLKVDEPLDPEVAKAIGISGQQRLEDRGLYGYNFKTLTIDIIGSAYERYLAHDIQVDEKAQRVLIEETEKLRKKEGIYYTPSYVVDYIVANTVKPLVSPIVKESIRLIKEDRFEEARKKIEKLRTIYILDPACGSGSFLIKAFDALVEGYIKYNETFDEELQKLLNKSGLRQYLDVSGKELRIRALGERVLLDNIYGVDLDPQAVEITKLNLWLKALSVAPEVYRPSLGKRQRRLLPSLETKIRVGNSLCSGLDDEDIKDLTSRGTLHILAEKRRKVEDFILKSTPHFNNSDNLYAWTVIQQKLSELVDSKVPIDLMGKQSLVEKELFDEENGVLKGLTGPPLNWEAEFPEVFLQRGFDVIIGNPPHGGDLTDEERSFIAKSYQLGKGYKNTAFLFLEMCLRNLKPDGKLGMVIPKSLTFSQKWGKVRKFLRENFSIYEIADISKAFKKVLLEQVVILADKTVPVPKHFYGLKLEERILKPEDRYTIPFTLCDEVDAFPLLIDSTALTIHNKMYNASIPLGKISKTFRGFPHQSKLSREKGEDKEPILRGDNIKRFFYLKPSEYLDLYLLKDKYGEWKDKTKKMKQNKIVAQRIIAHIKHPVDHIAIMATHDKEGLVSVDTVENILINNIEYDIEYVLALLNSRLIGWYSYYFIFCNAIRTMDFDEYYVNKIPIIPTSSENKTLIKEICEKINEMRDLAQQKNWMSQTFKNLISNYNVNKETSLSYYLFPSRTLDYFIDLTSTIKGEKMLGTITDYYITIEDDSIKIEVNLKDNPPFEALRLDFTDNEIRDYFYLSLNRHEGRKAYRSKKIIVDTVLKDLTIPKLETGTIVSNVETYRKMMEELRITFLEKYKLDVWPSSPVKEFDPSLLIRYLIKTDEEINSKMFKLYGLMEEEITYIVDKIPPLTRLI